MKKINVGIIGLGNCAASLIQGIEYYRQTTHAHDGITKKDIGGYTFNDIDIKIAFDVDKRKVGKSIGDAIYSKPNCVFQFVSEVKNSNLVYSAPVLDGVSEHMLEYNADHSFRITDIAALTEEEIISLLIKNDIQILVNYLPVGSQIGTEFWANICLKTGISFLNCIPVFIASDPIWEQKFIDAKIPIIGDDMKSQFGASIVSQVLQELAFSRGHKVKCHIQQNFGGNTDFLNMTNKHRLISKKISKENVIRSQNIIHNVPSDESFLFAGPSDYIEYYGDNKIAHFHLELEGFGGAPVILDAKLSVQDSPNSAGVVIDAIRYLIVAKEMGIVGALRGPSAFTQKSPPLQMAFKDAEYECDQIAQRTYTSITQKQIV